MKRRIQFLAVAGLLTALGFSGQALAVSLAVNDQIKLTNGPGNNPGGEFIADIVGPKGKAQGDDFRTFCLEKNEYFNWGETLTISGISTAAKWGGVAGQTAGTHEDPLDSRTAYLYFLFSTGNLAGYDYNVAAEREKDGTALQNLIWYLENETSTAPAIGSQGRRWLDDANAHAGTGLWGVRVLNLTRANGQRGQDQLYYPVPEPGTMVLLGSGLLGLSRVVRRRSKAS